MRNLKVGLLWCAFVVFTPATAGAQSFTVTTTLDCTGCGSLRDAILQANASGLTTIDLTGLTGTITLASPLPTLTYPVSSIIGPAGGGLTLGGGANARLAINVNIVPTVQVSNLSIGEAEVSLPSGRLKTLTNGVLGPQTTLALGNNGNLHIDSTSQQAAVLKSLGGSGTIIFGANGILTVGGTNADSTIRLFLSGPSSSALRKIGTGTLVLTGLGDDGLSISGPHVIADGGVIELGETGYSGPITNNTTVRLRTVGGASSLGQMTGPGSVEKVGSGRWSLLGPYSHTGGTFVLEGTLSINTNSLQGSIVNSSTLEFSQFGEGTFGGSITGSGRVLKTGTGTVHFTTPQLHTGGTQVSSGLLALDAPNILSPISPITVSSGARLDVNASQSIGTLSPSSGTIGLASGAILTINQGSDATFTGTITGAGALVKSGAAALTYGASSAPLHTGGTWVRAGTLAGSSSSLRGDITNDATVVFDQGSDGTFSGVMTGTGTLVKNGVGALTLPGVQSYGGAIVNAGRLIGTSDSLKGELLVNGQLVFDQSFDGTHTGPIAGIGSLVKQGIGTLTLSGSSTYAGGTQVLSGILRGDTNSLVNTIENRSVVQFHQTFDGTFNGSIFGAGALLKSGAGMLTIMQPQTYTGLTEVADGQLNLNAPLAGSVLVDTSATLGGFGIIGGSATVAGILIGTVPGSLEGTVKTSVATPAAGSWLSVAGDVLLGPSATYGASIHASEDSVLRVGGGVVIDSALLAISDATPTMPRALTVPLFVAEQGASASFSRVSASIPLDAFLTVRNTTTYVTLERTDIALASVATSASGQAAGAAMDAARTTATPDLRSAIRELEALTDSGTADGLNQLSGVAYANTARVGVLDGQRMIRFIADRLADIRTPPAIERSASSRMLPDRVGFWLRSVYDTAAMSAAASDGRINGTLLGFDHPVGSSWTIGALAGYDHAAITTQDGSSTTQDRRYRFGGYTTYVGSGFYVGAGIAGGYHTYETNRHVTFAAMLDPRFGGGPLLGGIDFFASARLHGLDGSGFVDAGLTRSFDSLTLQPFAGIEWSLLRRDAFVERGGGGLALVAPEGHAASARAAAGLRTTRAFNGLGSTRFIPHLEVRYAHEVLGQNAPFEASFAGASVVRFTIPGDRFGGHAVSASAGLGIAFGRRLVVSGDYRASSESDNRVHAVSVGLAF